MFRRICLILGLFLVGCVTIIRNPIENLLYVDDGGPANAKLTAAIIQNDAASVRGILKGKSFTTKGTTFFDDRNSIRSLEQEHAYRVLDLAITGKSHEGYSQAPDGVCRAEVVQAILDANLPPRDLDLYNAAMVPCPDVMEVIFSKPVSTTGVAKTTEVFLKSFNQKILEGQINIDQSSKWSQVLKLFSEAADNSTKLKLADAEQNLDSHVRKPIRDSQEAQKYLQTKYKMPFCPQPDLYNSIYSPVQSDRNILDNCIYIIRGPLKVMQVINGGVLVTLMQPNSYAPDQVFFIKTNKKYVDEDPVGDILVQSTGITKYKNILGAEKTIRAFEYLGDVKLLHDRNSNNYQFASGQN